MARQMIISLVKNILPYGIVRVIQKTENSFLGRRALYPDNRKLAGIHDGETCFIVCNGPSVLRQDLKKLRGYTVFSVSNGYRHKHFPIYEPKYHCLPQVTRAKLSDKDVVDWFREMDSKLGRAILFLSDTEKEIVKRYSLFDNRKVIFLRLSTHEKWGKDVDLSRSLPRPQSVPVMCIMIAIYMRFKNIVLLGVEHDFFLTGEYKYFYESHSPVLSGKLVGVDSRDHITDCRYTQFCQLKALWEQYYSLASIAERHNIKIYNATNGGELDVYPRVSYESYIDSINWV